jgi:hypothetical protein
MQLEVVERPGSGVDRGQLWDGLRLAPAARLAYAVGSANALAELLSRAREVPA